MLWMETFCFYCSVRLGVIISAILSLIELTTPLIFFFVCKSDLLKSAVDTIQQDDEYSQHAIIKKLLKALEENPENFITVIEAILITHIIFCIFAIYGAYKIYKWYLVPYGTMEFFRFLTLLTSHIIAMIVLKKIMNLGILIAATIAGGFAILFIGYRWAAVVALFQIIQLVQSDKYKMLYGDDPFQDWEIDEYNNFGTNIKMFSSTHYDDSFAMTKAWEKLPKKGLTDKGIAIIPIDEPDITVAVKEYQNWHLNELIRPKRSNLIKFY